MVILDGHTTDAEFCCAPGVFNGSGGATDLDDAVGDGLTHWQQRQQFFETDWSTMAELFKGYHNVIGDDLRNEPSGAYGQSAHLGRDRRSGPDSTPAASPTSRPRPTGRKRPRRPAQSSFRPTRTC